MDTAIVVERFLIDVLGLEDWVDFDTIVVMRGCISEELWNELLDIVIEDLRGNEIEEDEDGNISVKNKQKHAATVTNVKDHASNKNFHLQFF